MTPPISPNSPASVSPVEPERWTAEKVFPDNRGWCIADAKGICVEEGFTEAQAKSIVESFTAAIERLEQERDEARRLIAATGWCESEGSLVGLVTSVCDGLQSFRDRDSGKKDAPSDSVEAAIQKALKECPWPESVWLTTIDEAGKAMRDLMGDGHTTAVSGTLMRHGWQCAEKAVQEILSEHSNANHLAAPVSPESSSSPEAGSGSGSSDTGSAPATLNVK